MIMDVLKNAAVYDGLGERFRKAFEYLASNDFSKIEPGRYDIDGNKVFALVQRYETKQRDKGVWEAHRRYADVQYVASGIETQGYAPIGRLEETQPYSAEKDVLFLAGSGDTVTADGGTFVIYFPHDGHMPGLAFEKPAPVVKVVVKVLVEQ